MNTQADIPIHILISNLPLMFFARRLWGYTAVYVWEMGWSFCGEGPWGGGVTMYVREGSQVRVLRWAKPFLTYEVSSVSVF